MRPIKFRGKGLFDDKWYHGSLMTKDNYFSTHYGMNCTAISFLRDGRTKRHPIEESTVGQYTGLKDKKGVEIYEGDIVAYYSDHHTVNGVVKYGINAFQNLKNIGFYIEWENDGTNMWGDWWRNDILFWSESGLKVIGNIHENPELLDL